MSVCVCMSMNVCYTAREHQAVLGCPASTAYSGLFSLLGCCCPAPCTTLCEVAAAGHRGISLQSRACPCGILLYSRAPAGHAEPPDVSGGNPPLQHCWEDPKTTPTPCVSLCLGVQVLFPAIVPAGLSATSLKRGCGCAPHHARRSWQPLCAGQDGTGQRCRKLRLQNSHLRRGASSRDRDGRRWLSSTGLFSAGPTGSAPGSTTTGSCGLSLPGKDSCWR